MAVDLQQQGKGEQESGHDRHLDEADREPRRQPGHREQRRQKQPVAARLLQPPFPQEQPQDQQDAEADHERHDRQPERHKRQAADHERLFGRPKAVFAAQQDAEHDGRPADRVEGRAHIVELRPPVGRDVLANGATEGQHQDDDDHLQPEGPAPTGVGGQIAADDWPHGRAHGGDGADDGIGEGAVLAVIGVAQQRLDVG